MKLLFIGDIVGKIGRLAVAAILPDLLSEHKPDLVIANVENLAHGKGITAKTLTEILDAGVDVCTSGNHILNKPEGRELLAAVGTKVIRPANFPTQSPGQGELLVQIARERLLIVNLVGQVFMKEGATYTNPFTGLDAILDAHKDQDLAGIFVDFHAEVTSEKVAMGWYADGRVSAVVGTHTHVPTADQRILPDGTAYITDVGMTGARDSVIGMEREPIVARFASGETGTGPAGIPESGAVVLNAVLVELDPASRKALRIERLDRIFSV